MSAQTNIERCTGQEKCEKCPKTAEFLLKTDDPRAPFPNGARTIALCRNDLTAHLGKNPALMAHVLISLIEQKL